jgi:competence protein ComGF
MRSARGTVAVIVAYVKRFGLLFCLVSLIVLYSLLVLICLAAIIYA